MGHRLIQFITCFPGLLPVKATGRTHISSTLRDLQERGRPLKSTGASSTVSSLKLSVVSASFSKVVKVIKFSQTISHKITGKYYEPGLQRVLHKQYTVLLNECVQCMQQSNYDSQGYCVIYNQLLTPHSAVWLVSGVVSIKFSQ